MHEPILIILGKDVTQKVVRLSARISREPHARYLPNFYACCLCPWLGHPSACWR